MNDCRQMDAAIDQWALETCQSDGNNINTTGAQTYLKSTWKTLDPLGKAYVTTVVGTTQVSINTATKTALAGVGIDWGIY